MGSSYNFDNFIDDVQLFADLWAPVASGAGNILTNRGAYGPRGEIFRGSRPTIVRTPLGNVHTTSKVLNAARVTGKVLGAANVLAIGYEITQDLSKGNYKSATARLAVAGIAAGTAFIPVFGWGISMRIGIVDYVWGDDFYKWIEN